MKKMMLAVTAALAIMTVAQAPVAIKVKAAADSKAKTPTVVLTVTIPDGYHIYSRAEKTGIPTAISVSEPKGVTATVVWPKTVPFEGLEGTQQVYEGTVKFPVKVSAKGMKGKKTLKFALKSQMCNDRTCLPPTTVMATATVTLK